MLNFSLLAVQRRCVYVPKPLNVAPSFPWLLLRNIASYNVLANGFRLDPPIFRQEKLCFVFLRMDCVSLKCVGSANACDHNIASIDFAVGRNIYSIRIRNTVLRVVAKLHMYCTETWFRVIDASAIRLPSKLLPRQFTAIGWYRDRERERERWTLHYFWTVVQGLLSVS